MKKMGSLRASGLPESAGRRLTPCIGIVALPRMADGYFAPVTRPTVGMMSMKCAGCRSNVPLRCRATPAGQCAIKGVDTPPSCVKCLYRRKGVLLSVAQFMPIKTMESGLPRCSPS